MSTLNQAFIKVYQQQRVNAPHVRFPAPPAEPADSAAQPNASVAAEQPAVADEKGTVADAARDPEPSATPATLVRRFHWPALVESLEEAAAELRHLTAAGQPRMIVSLSSQRGAGGTTLALLVARHLSSQGARAVLVDADLDRPALADRLGVNVEVDWQWAWCEKLPLEEALVESLADGIALLPLRKAASPDARQASPAALSHILAELARRYDVVCIDGGPLDVRNGEATLQLGGAAIDLACVVHDARRGQPEQAETIAQQIERSGVQKSIIVDNFVRATHV